MQNHSIQVDHLLAFVGNVLRGSGCPDDDAMLTANCLVEADLCGVHTHGVVRLPIYVNRLVNTYLNPHPKHNFVEKTTVCHLLDGDNGLGFVAGCRAIDRAAQIAHSFGVGVVGVRNSNHFGMAASFVRRAIDAGFASLVFTNASPAMPPWGGREALLGTSPLAAGAPSTSGKNFVLDMSPAVAARGKIRLAAKRGADIPLGMALDKHGAPTTDPHEALKGVVLPLGGHKGSGLSMMMDIFAGVLTGAAFGGDVVDQYKNPEKAQNVGHLFILLKPGLFVSTDEFEHSLNQLVQRVKNVPLAEGFDEILIPGEREERLRAERMANGIVLGADEIDQLNELARTLGAAPLSY